MYDRRLSVQLRDLDPRTARSLIRSHLYLQKICIRLDRNKSGRIRRIICTIDLHRLQRRIRHRQLQLYRIGAAPVFRLILYRNAKPAIRCDILTLASTGNAAAHRLKNQNNKQKDKYRCRCNHRHFPSGNSFVPQRFYPVLYPFARCQQHICRRTLLWCKALAELFFFLCRCLSPALFRVRDLNRCIVVFHVILL